MTLETGQEREESFEDLVAAMASTKMSIEEMAHMTGLAVGDVYALLDKSRWLLYSMTAVADKGGMSRVAEMADGLLSIIDSRLHQIEEDSNDSY